MKILKASVVVSCIWFVLLAAFYFWDLHPLFHRFPTRYIICIFPTSLLVTYGFRELLKKGNVYKKWWLPVLTIPTGAYVFGLLTLSLLWVQSLLSETLTMEFAAIFKVSLIYVTLSMGYFLIFTYPAAYLSQVVANRLMAEPVGGANGTR